ncbi:Na(+)-translocating NADH-quinone reductase subunit E [Yersinia enterocolitica]|uniref:multidrug/biocide efflux PACE transporter n=1 Tax=Yersinia enterocolitica TaxID=630 RepID=UPI000327DF0F|nr:multidrug/biocide efflux PACE transporter [Yersinia enterocolitica]AOF15757.1 Na(+)-translocating NADH-quinone reductase subunit E [Yersinia enterocolitica]AOF19822.1 Na(+)-translocating NADH-quinone reductase subunit E [Yersinia enterocolitica]AOF24359.1 Na(+)-translocating NADH-quinone reductase subunit E [Yersinia enterocolitica]AOF27999.1 Na(+)-translocating NADH-quinone reductase subunit E [Yersinia enterocolitica]AOF32175.1 Na(+)-translocating NADH-quinone reductase subunit E [Yersini
MQVQRKTIFERIIHAIGFEVIAVAICAPVGAWLLDRSVLQMGTLAILLSSVAMLWNIIYNSLFDYFWPVSRVAKTLRVRAFHALGFESGFILIGLPIVVGVLGVSLLQALMLEIGFFLFFLPYTMFYNWAYDSLRARIIRSRQANALTPAADKGRGSN